MPQKRLKKSERTLFDNLRDDSSTEANESLELKDTTSTFSDNLGLCVHRWFRYSAGFSALWVREVLQRAKQEGKSKVLDPFAGSGTVALEAEQCCVESIGLEAHPFVARIAQAKLNWRQSPKNFKSYSLSVLEEAKSEKIKRVEYPTLMQKCFPIDSLNRLEAIRNVWQRCSDDSPISVLTWLTLCSILRECSPVGTAQWQYVLPNKKKSRVVDPFAAFENKTNLFSEDMAYRQSSVEGEKAVISADDARECKTVPSRWADLVITSPPYANNYDYADATRLEMTFFGEIEGWGCLQETVRAHLVRSCTQHVAPLMKQTESIIQSKVLIPIARELTETCRKLATERECHGGKKPYHTMIAAYFKDMAEVWHSLRRSTATDSQICFVIGDSAPYGVYVPVDRWLGELAIAAGFKSFKFEKTRDRNVKWKNRKHQVPLHEGRLWVEG
ncbi:MAG TPA: hypothetical protein VG122_05285 [Gemmata sp.]|jgi:hypothetical protein|nr:hypothetical protein [Gemmata sp.]